MDSFDEPHTKVGAEEAFEKRRSIILSIEEGSDINASGHKDQLRRQYGLLGICGLALTIDNAWIALGGSITVAICECLVLRDAQVRLVLTPS